jgi:hypothetical protein
MIASESIPKDYNELQKQYGKLIRKILVRYSKIKSRRDLLEDLHSYVWLKIIEAELIDRFGEYIQKQTPKVFTALEVCDFLGISWYQWATAMWSYHRGGKKCFLMPTPINIEEFQVQDRSGCSAKTALFAYDDIILLTLDSPFRLMGREIREGVVVGPERPEGYLKYPEVRATGLQFQNYLVRSVLNHCSNFFRNLKRRHKERPVTPSVCAAEDFIWEATLVDTNKVAADSKVALEEAKRILSETLRKDETKSSEEQKEQEEAIFADLENGVSLFRALQNVGLPPKLRRIMVNAVCPRKQNV